VTSPAISVNKQVNVDVPTAAINLFVNHQTVRLVYNRLYIALSAAAAM